MAESNLYNDNHEYYEEQAAPAPQKKRRRGRSGVWTVLKVLGTLLLIGICTAAVLGCFAAVYIRTVILPQSKLDLGVVEVKESSIMYYRDKTSGTYKELVTLLSDEDTIWVEYNQLPQNLINAAVAIEDRRFWEHHGVDWKRTAGAIYYMFTGRDIQGGSTITQQLIKNITTYDDVTVKRKVIEIFRALEFDKTYGKQTTLEWYMNYIYLGSNCRGVGAASYEYFGKPVEELTLAECASLISITNNPSIYSPYSDLKMKNRDGELWTAKQWNKYRQEIVLWRMLEDEYITQAEYDRAVNQELVFVRGEEEQSTSTIYSWYEEQVRADIIADLMEQYDYSKEMAERVIKTGGLRIYTCLDPDVQAQVEKVYNDESNLNYYSSSGEHLQSAITVIDNATGDLVGLAGGLGEKTGNLWFNMASAAKRQPGSSIKPLAVYAPGIDMGLITPASVVDDYPHNLSGRGRPWPVNVDGVYRGLVTVREAVANSYNTVAVRVLADYVTPAKGFEYAHDKFHLSTLVEARMVGGEVKSDIDVSPLATGGLTDGTNPHDMAAAFAVFPNNGIYRPPRTYTRVTNSDGTEVILDKQSVQEAAIKETTAYYINSLLRNVVTSGGGTAANFNSQMFIAGKTGTTDSKHDRWFVGYTPYYTAAAWVGYSKNPARVEVSGNPALNMWKLVMSGIHKELEPKQLSNNNPGGLVSPGSGICRDSGLLATEYCRQDPRGSRVFSDYLFSGDAPTQYCTYHTAETTVTYCMDSPILDEDGQPTNQYYLAGEFCPEESQKTVTMVGYDRKPIGNAVARDAAYLFSSVNQTQVCPIHNGKELPVDPDDLERPGEDNPEQPGEGGSQQPDPGAPNHHGTSGDPGASSNPGATVSPGGEAPVGPGQAGGDAPGETTAPNINPATGLPWGL